jgi:predicted Zn-dependent protease
MRQTIMHEIGHTVGICISDANHKEVYCGQPYSVMAHSNTNNLSEDYQAYDWEHWSLRSMP